jgi:hypothetical protein
MRIFFKLLIAPALLVLLCELAFQAGAWEPWARMDSHAGTSIVRKRALTDPAFAHVDFVTLGSSRPEYGIDHEALAALAQQHGKVHVDLSMPGGHWMSLEVLGRWLKREHPEVQGGVIGLSAQDFLSAGNGAYELGIVYPFHRVSDIASMRQHVPFDRADPATWATYSALLQYREDVQDYLHDPEKRAASIAWWQARPARELLQSNPHRSENMCDVGLDDLTACDRAAALKGEHATLVQRQCQDLRGAATGRFDLAALTRQPVLPDFLQHSREIIQDALRNLRWPRPPVVVLMPMPRVWLDAVSPQGMQAWALDVLKPLADEGSIRLVDATHALETPEGTDCTMFFDFYHQNDLGRAALMRRIRPQIETSLYGKAAAAEP